MRWSGGPTCSIRSQSSIIGRRKGIDLRQLLYAAQMAKEVARCSPARRITALEHLFDRDLIAAADSALKAASR